MIWNNRIVKRLKCYGLGPALAAWWIQPMQVTGFEAATPVTVTRRRRSSLPLVGYFGLLVFQWTVEHEFGGRQVKQ